MRSKKIVEGVVNKYYRLIIKDLDLESWAITIRVLHSADPELKKMKVAKHARTDLRGVSFVRLGKADIILYYDVINNKDEAIGTLIHELLHCFFNKLTGLVTSRIAHSVEEKMVLRLEDVLLHTYKLRAKRL